MFYTNLTGFEFKKSERAQVLFVFAECAAQVHHLTDAAACDQFLTSVFSPPLIIPSVAWMFLLRSPYNDFTCSCLGLLHG